MVNLKFWKLWLGGIESIINLDIYKFWLFVMPVSEELYHRPEFGLTAAYYSLFS